MLQCVSCSICDRGNVSLRGGVVWLAVAPNRPSFQIKRMWWHRNIPLQWRHNRCDSVPNHPEPHDCSVSRLFKRKSKKTPKLRVTGLCEGNSPVSGEFPEQMANYAENVSIWWRHHATCHAICKNSSRSGLLLYIISKQRKGYCKLRCPKSFMKWLINFPIWVIN